MRFGKVQATVLVLTAAMGFCLLSFARLHAQGTLAPVAAPSRVAVCNIVEVLVEYQRAKDLTKELNDQGEAIEAENKQRLKKAEELQTQLDGLKAGSPKYDETLEAVQRHEVSRQVWLRMKQEEMLRKHRRLTEEMFKDIRAAVEEVAKERGFDIVLQSQPVELQEAKNVQEVVAQIDRQKVLYNSPASDITAAVLQRINEGYRLKKK